MIDRSPAIAVRLCCSNFRLNVAAHDLRGAQASILLSNNSNDSTCCGQQRTARELHQID